MLRTIIWFIYFWVYLIFVMPSLMKVNRLDREGKIEERDQEVDLQVKKWAQSLVRLTGSKVRVIGEEHVPQTGPVVFVGNHQGNFDVPILLGYIKKPKAFLSKMEVKKLPFIRDWMTHMQCVFIERGNVREGLKAINQAAETVKRGYSMVLFPEGTRSRGERVGEFKAGSLKLATKAGVPIVPVTIKGSYKIMEANRWGFIMKPAEVEIVISEPIDTANLSKEEVDELPGRLREIIISKM